MVTFRDGKPYKAGYRKFRMKTVLGTDDYASLAETVSRRAAEYEKYAALAAQGQGSDNYFGQKPDLLLMDGGRGQVSAARRRWQALRWPMCPFTAWSRMTITAPEPSWTVRGREIAINMNRGTFTFITAIQDETHRFANAYRKQQMRKKSYSSHPDRGARGGSQNGQGPDDTVQERGCCAGRPPPTSWKIPPVLAPSWHRPSMIIFTHNKGGRLHRQPPSLAYSGKAQFSEEIS